MRIYEWSNRTVARSFTTAINKNVEAKYIYIIYIYKFLSFSRTMIEADESFSRRNFYTKGRGAVAIFDRGRISL